MAAELLLPALRVPAAAATRSDKAIRRGVFQPVPDLIDAIETYLAANH